MTKTTFRLKLEIDVSDKGRHEIIDIAVKAFELSQSLREKWFDADYAAKRRILEIIGLNWTLDDVSLVPEWRKPFDLLAKGLVSKDSRDDWRIFEPYSKIRQEFVGNFRDLCRTATPWLRIQHAQTTNASHY